MAEGYAKKKLGDRWEIYSAGTHPAFAVAPLAVEVMKEVGIDISSQFPKKIEDLPIRKADVLVTMGCEVECPNFPHELLIEWSIPDPIGKPLEFYRKVRDMIMDHIDKLEQEIEEQSRKKTDKI